MRSELRQVPPLHGLTRALRPRLPGHQVLRVRGQVRTTACCPAPTPSWPSTSRLTGLHGLHVIGGMVVNAYFWGRAPSCGRPSPSSSPTGSRTRACSGTSSTWSGSSSSRSCICSRRARERTARRDTPARPTHDHVDRQEARPDVHHRLRDPDGRSPLRHGGGLATSHLPVAGRDRRSP